MIRVVIVFVLSLLGIMAQILMKRGVRGIAFAGVRDIPSQIAQLIINPYIALALAIYIVGFVAYLLLLSKMQVSVLYPLTVAMSFALISVVSLLFLSEPLSIAKAMGLIFIIAGISLISITA